MNLFVSEIQISGQDGSGVLANVGDALETDAELAHPFSGVIGRTLQVCVEKRQSDFAYVGLFIKVVNGVVNRVDGAILTSTRSRLRSMVDDG